MAELLFFLYILSFFVQLIFFIAIYGRLAVYQTDRNGEPWSSPEPVSIVVCAHNEARQLEKNIPKLLHQKGLDFELIVVDDASTDGTAAVLDKWSIHSNRLKVCVISPDEKFHRGKKQALHVGIQRAANDLVLLCDADCSPISDFWAFSMVSTFEKSTKVVLGHSPGKRQKGFWSRLARFEILINAVHYFGFALAGIPYMGTGRNLAYHRSIRMDHSIKEHLDLISGDDDLLLNQVVNSKNTVVNMRAEAFMETDVKTSLPELWQQKRRHLTTAFRYTYFHQFLLGALNGSRFLFYFSFLYLLGTTLEQLVLVSALFLFHACFLLVLFKVIGKKLGNSDLPLLLLLMDVVSVFFNSFVVFSTLFVKSRRWK